MLTSESETTGQAFRGRQRLRIRPEQIDTGIGNPNIRNKVRTKLRFEPANDESVEETETVPPTTASRSRTRSRFPGSRVRGPTGQRVVVTGARKRQRFRDNSKNEASTEDINDFPEEDRRSEIGSLRRKVNRVPNFTSRRKTTPPPETPATRIPPRRRLRPFNFEDVNEQEIVSVETESPQLLVQDQEEEEDQGISVQPVSTVG